MIFLLLVKMVLAPVFSLEEEHLIVQYGGFEAVGSYLNFTEERELKTSLSRPEDFTFKLNRSCESFIEFPTAHFICSPIDESIKTDVVVGDNRTIILNSKEVGNTTLRFKKFDKNVEIILE